jgi:vancomycin resistance protein VanW
LSIIYPWFRTEIGGVFVGWLEAGVVYRNGEVYRDVIDRQSGQILDSQLIRTNHARVMYDCPPSLTIIDK